MNFFEKNLSARGQLPPLPPLAMPWAVQVIGISFKYTFVGIQMELDAHTMLKKNFRTHYG